MNSNPIMPLTRQFSFKKKKAVPQIKNMQQALADYNNASAYYCCPLFSLSFFWGGGFLVRDANQVDAVSQRFPKLKIKNKSKNKHAIMAYRMRLIFVVANPRGVVVSPVEFQKK